MKADRGTELGAQGQGAGLGAGVSGPRAAPAAWREAGKGEATRPQPLWQLRARPAFPGAALTPGSEPRSPEEQGMGTWPPTQSNIEAIK